MDQKKQPRPLSLEDIFAEAAERVQAGEPVDAVIASYAPEFHKPLRGLLPIVETASHLHHADIPAIATDRRSANRKALLQAAAQKRAQLSPIAPTAIRKPQLAATPTLGERLAAFLSSLQAGFAPNPLRLALTVAALVLLIFGPTTLVTQAQSSVPGDLTYPVKQWIREQEIAFTPVERLAEVRSKQEAEYRADVQKAQVKADQQKRLISTHGVMIFHGYSGEYLQIGSLHVMPCYQPDLNDQACIQMTIPGALEPGAIVLLTFQILPGQAGEQETPRVQGISLEVMPHQPTEQEAKRAAAPTSVPAVPPLPTNTPIPPPTDTPVVEPTITEGPSPTCTVLPVRGWVPYNAAAGETVETIAARFGISEGELRAVNCITNGGISPDGVFLVPDTLPVITPEPGATAITVTVESPTVVVSPTVEGIATPVPTANPAVTPTLTSPISGTVIAPPTSTLLPTTTGGVTPTLGLTPVSTPLGTVVPISTTMATPAATGITPIATPLTVTPVPVTPAATPTESTPATPPETPTEDGVSGASATPAEPPITVPDATEPPPSEPPTAVPEPPTATPMPLPTAPPPTEPPLPTATAAGAAEGVSAAEAAPATEPESANQGSANEPAPFSQPSSPLQNP